MFLQEELILKSYQEKQLYLKFIRRPDITPALRLYIGGVALFNSSELQTQELMQRYNISRSFVYHLRKQLLLYGGFIFEQASKSSEFVKEELEEDLHLLRSILSLRLEGRCSIISISLLLKRQGLKNSSVGYISELLKAAGGKLDKVIDVESGRRLAVVFASDEVFSSGCPLLITVDPVSSAILHLELGKDRRGMTWAAHWQELLDTGLHPVLLTSDAGTGLRSGRECLEGLKQVNYQQDTFHALAHRLGDTCRVLHKKAWAAVKEEYEREKKIASAKKESVVEQRFALYETAVNASKQAIKLYDDYRLYYRYMLEQLNLFDEQGELRRRKTNEANLHEAIQVMETLGHLTTNQELKTVKQLLQDGLLNFQQQAANIVHQLEQTCSSAAQRAALKKICRAYHYLKRQRKSKNADKKAYFRQQQNQWLLQAKACWEQTPQQSWDYETFQKYAYAQLARIIQSSALVETINSIVRLYLNNSKNQITQQHLNLIMFYHNHRRYVQGVRKNQTPMELLTGQEQKQDWLDLLIEKVYCPNATKGLQVAHLDKVEKLPKIEVSLRKKMG